MSLGNPVVVVVVVVSVDNHPVVVPDQLDPVTKLYMFTSYHPVVDLVPNSTFSYLVPVTSILA